MVTLVGGAAQTGSTQWQHMARAAGKGSLSRATMGPQGNKACQQLCYAEQTQRHCKSHTGSYKGSFAGQNATTPQTSIRPLSGTTGWHKQEGCGKQLPEGPTVTDLSIAALSAATACSTSVMMLPGPIALTLMLCRASASAMHLHITATLDCFLQRGQSLCQGHL